MIGLRLALERATIQRAVDTFPSLAQALMLAEECGELVVAVSHVERGRAQAVDLPTEIAVEPQRSQCGAADVTSSPSTWRAPRPRTESVGPPATAPSRFRPSPRPGPAR